MSDESLLRVGENQTEPDEVAFDYIKTSDFRITWVDGAIGGPTPRGNVHVALYAERPAIPRRQVFKLDPMTSLIGPLMPEKTITRMAYVREMPCDLMMTPAVARTLGEWLIQQADLMTKGGTTQ
jgi:hypothetical protein